MTAQNEDQLQSEDNIVKLLKHIQHGPKMTIICNNSQIQVEGSSKTGKD